MAAATFSVPPRSLDQALAFVRRGGSLCVRTAVRITMIDASVIARFEKAKEWLLKEEGDAYRLRSGRGSVYLMPGQLESVGRPVEAVAAPQADSNGVSQ